MAPLFKGHTFVSIFKHFFIPFDPANTCAHSWKYTPDPLMYTHLLAVMKTNAIKVTAWVVGSIFSWAPGREKNESILWYYATVLYVILLLTFHVRVRVHKTLIFKG